VTAGPEPLPPWLEPQWRQLLQRWSDGRLPHALLLEGRDGLGKARLAAHLVQRLLCTEAVPGETSCNRCRSCRLLASGAHPDARWIRPDPEKRRPLITVDAIRELTGFLALSSQYGGYRLAVIEPADAMNVNAANSLLKTLEEPPEDCVLLLVTARPARLPATVRSRCQRLPLPVPARSDALAWLRARLDAEHDAEALLEQAYGAPLAALTLAREGAADRPARMAETLAALHQGRLAVDEAAAEWAEEGATVAALTLQRVLIALLRTAAGAPPPAGIGDQSAFRRMAAGLDSKPAFRYLDEIVSTLRALQQPLNEPLTLEALFARWLQLGRSMNRTRAGK
jgi:DNA polymerase-3 subunit delta'